MKLTLVVGLLIAVALEASMSQGRGQMPATVTPADYMRWRAEYKNWGRWGADDQKGTTNLITPQKVLSAVKLVKNGIVISLAHAEPQRVEADVPASAVFHRTTNAISATNTTDNYQVSYHGLSSGRGVLCGHDPIHQGAGAIVSWPRLQH